MKWKRTTYQANILCQKSDQFPNFKLNTELDLKQQILLNFKTQCF